MLCRMLAFSIFGSMEVLLIPFLTVYIIDFALIPEHIKRWWYYRKYHKTVQYKPFSVKPFDCSGCMTFWLTLSLTIAAPITLYGLWSCILLSTFNGVIALLLRKWIN